MTNFVFEFLRQNNWVSKLVEELIFAIKDVAKMIQNRMESTIRNQSSISENESDARSRIRDTDFASETAALTSNQIIQQASQTILTQANQRPTIALQLLGQQYLSIIKSIRQPLAAFSFANSQTQTTIVAYGLQQN